MNDRELLQCAAKAAGYHVAPQIMGRGFIRHDQRTPEYWNPLVELDDALHLAIDLEMSVEISKHEGSTFAYAGGVPRCYACESWRSGKTSATCRAIVRAAAEVWRAAQQSKGESKP